MYSICGKRMFDLIVACLLVISFSPIILFLCILVKIFLGSPIFFKQPRPGLNEKIFYIYKFRTMLNRHDKNGILLNDDRRLTTFGKWMRSLSLDELPELINIIKGDMSLVGPRPLLADYLPYYDEKEKKRHSIRPGITGWAQINGRNTLSWKKKFEFDVWYVNHLSFLLDLKIIFITLIKIFKREGINANGHATMSRFDLEKKSNQS
jgi:lipopolysaccharide/colanic/teichoic acid biosynthesis glycosyltransferase